MRSRVLFLALVACALLLSAAGAEAATFTVNSPSDIPDVNPGDGVCETAPGNGVCTLRAAIQEANAHPGANTIILQANTTYLLTRVGVDDTALNGDLDITNSVTIVGAGATSTIIDGNGGVTGERVFQISACIGGGNTCDSNHPVTVVSISGVTIQHGNASTGFGGGILNNGTLTLVNSSVISNTAGGANAWAGGIFNGGTLTLTNSNVSGNTTGGSNPYGGGIFNQGPMTIINSTISGNTTPGVGGGIYNVGNTATVTSSTISGNSAANGGGIYKTGSPLVVINSTISGNFSTGNGGGIYASAGTTSLFNVTITHNQANSDGSGVGIGGGVWNANGSTLSFQNSIIALNENVTDTGGPFDILNDDDCSGTITSQGNNIMYAVDSSHCTVSGPAVTVVYPNLGPLQNNGGPTQTHALLSGGPAIDAGNSGGCTDNLGAILTSDQRGFPRPDGVHCDIGAFEFGGTLRIQKVGSNVQLTWPQGTLLEANVVTGPYTTNNATSPYTFAPTGSAKFYKLRVQ